MSLRALAVPAALVLALTLSGCGGDEETTASDPAVPGDAETTECSYPESGMPPAAEVEPPPADAVAEGDVPVTLETSVGELALTLDAAGAPCTVNSFISLAEQGYFDGTTCHRLTSRNIFVLQCGDPTGTGTGGPGYSFADELSGDEAYTAGALAMANSGTDTNGSQFFIVYGDSTGLPKAYTVFGSVDDKAVSTLEEVAADGSVPPGDGAPNTPVDIESATVGD
jgi:peptidyl-prolyl cis-trans isomerase B (cyclophilin B)